MFSKLFYIAVVLVFTISSSGFAQTSENMAGSDSTQEPLGAPAPSKDEQILREENAFLKSELDHINTLHRKLSAVNSARMHIDRLKVSLDQKFKECAFAAGRTVVFEGALVAATIYVAKNLIKATSTSRKIFSLFNLVTGTATTISTSAYTIPATKMTCVQVNELSESLEQDKEALQKAQRAYEALLGHRS